MRRFLLSLGAAALLTLLPAPASAQPWPDFQVAGLLSGAPSSTRALLADGSWAVIVVRPDCTPCHDVLRRFDAEAAANRLPATRLLVLLSGVSRAEGAALRASAPSIPEAAWQRDEAGQAVGLLRAEAVPAVFGVRRGEIRWSLRGAQFTDAFIRDLVLPWFR